MNTTAKKTWMSLLAIGMIAAAAAPAMGKILVQDVAHLQGDRVRRLEAIGLVVGLNGTGDSKKNTLVWQSVLNLAESYGQSADSIDNLAPGSVALVSISVETPKHGFRDGQRLDVHVASFGGDAKSLHGGRLIAMPMMEAPITLIRQIEADKFEKGDLSVIKAIAGGKIELPDSQHPTAGVIRNGAVMQLNFRERYVKITIKNGHRTGKVSLIIEKQHASFPMAVAIANSINENIPGGGIYDRQSGKIIRQTNIATAIDANTVEIKVPSYELDTPSGFIQRVLETPMFFMPEQPAKVTINKTNKSVTITGTVTILPTVVSIPGSGTITIGGTGGNGSLVGVSTKESDDVESNQLLKTLQQMKLNQDQIIQVFEQLNRIGSLQGQLDYE